MTDDALDGAFVGQFRACFDAMAAAAVHELSSELSAPLGVTAAESTQALRRRSFHDGIAAHLNGPARG